MRLLANSRDITTFHIDENTLCAADYRSHTIWELNFNNIGSHKLQLASLNATTDQQKSVISKNCSQFIKHASGLALIGLIALGVALIKSKPRTGV
ncbi:hypothetical protein GCM10008090_07750 [Arenicella chitinivorans]|uniref:Uncharacterized protein n=1 Tax=Arenicella chitinivorans TaxID=1329800 RepID=A0A918RJ95_9GAMM|nr:hypothetical protein GCM10008090_07750 [Arenicella chitinivorans]